ncbi:MAG: hypothetical protein ABIO49_13970 [Dokdonella sp.]
MRHRPEPAQPDREGYACHEYKCADPWQMLQKHADAHSDETHQGQHNGCFDPTFRITIEVASRQREAQHNGERGGAALGIDRERAQKRSDRGEHRNDGFA